MTKTDILNFLKEHKNELKEKYQVNKIGLFGSFARDEANENSDIDLLINTKADINLLFEIEDFLEKNLHKKINIIREHKFLRERLLNSIRRDIIYV